MHNINDYQLLANRTAKAQSQRDAFDNAVYGLIGEVGEVVDMLKKHIFQGHPLARNQMTLELGDVLWYVVYLATLLEIPMSNVLQGNIDKLNNRYPNGYSAIDSINRAHTELIEKE